MSQKLLRLHPGKDCFIVLCIMYCLLAVPQGRGCSSGVKLMLGMQKVPILIPGIPGSRYSDGRRCERAVLVRGVHLQDNARECT